MTSLAPTAVVHHASNENHRHLDQEPTTAPHDNHTKQMHLTFDDMEDLTKRLVLLPRIEEEAIGAVVHSYVPHRNNGDHPTAAGPEPSSSSSSSSSDDGAETTPNLTTSKEGESQKEQQPAGSVMPSVSSDSSECRDEREVNPLLLVGNHNRTVQQVVGSILVGLDHQDGESLRDADFADILATIRSAAPPLMLTFEFPTDNSNNSSNEAVMDLEVRKSTSSSGSSVPQDDASMTSEGSTVSVALTREEDDEEASCSSSSCSRSFLTNQSDYSTQTEQESDVTAIPNTPTTVPAQVVATTPSPSNANNNTNSAHSLWSSWGTRMRTAAEAASTVAVQSLTAAAEQAAAKRKIANEKAASTRNQSNSNNNQQLPIFVQTSLGTFVQLTGEQQQQVTISSVVSVRQSALQACPLRGYSFQWYRSPAPEQDEMDDAEWLLLPGATNAAFQPSTTEIGYRLRCIVIIDNKGLKYLTDDDEDDDSDDGESEENTSLEPTTVVCETPQVVAADLSLFNGARQALVRGADFGGLQGLGTAQGRSFKVSVQMAYGKTRQSKRNISSALTMYQVVNQMAEPMHPIDQPFCHVSAISSHVNPKTLQLVFPPPVLDQDEPDQEACTMLSALLTEQRTLEVEAPNRFARESLLLAIGIANFKGEPADLNATTILYHDQQEDPQDDSTLDASIRSSCESGNRSVDGSQPLSSVDGESATTESQDRPIVVESTALSPSSSIAGSPPRSHRRDISVLSDGSMSALEDQCSRASTAEASVFVPDPAVASTSAEPTPREVELERELAFLRGKLTKKDKVVSELQRQVARSEQRASQHQHQAHQLQEDLRASDKAKQAAEKLMESHADKLIRLQSDHSTQLAGFTEKLKKQASVIADMEKTIKSQHNEKAVLTAAVGARETKLTKMAELQDSFVNLSSKVAQHDQLRNELSETTKRYQELNNDLQKVSQIEKECRAELDETQTKIQALQACIEEEKEKTASCEAELAVLQKKNQKLKAERNSNKQKADSLTKEISRICRNGRTVHEIEKILADDEARREEVELLRKQKRRALEECHSYRQAYEQSRAAHQLSGGDATAASALERNLELERLVSDLTEYVNAKEMQLETLKAVNDALQSEIHGLAKASMNTNEV